MKILIWAAFGVLAVFWTLGTLIVVELVQWGAQVIAAGAGVEPGRSAAPWPAPAWLPSWLDPAAIKAAQAGLLAGFEAFRGALPWVGSAVSWLVPLVWMTWGIGVALLLAMTGGAHWLASRWLTSRPLVAGDARALRKG